MACNFINVKPGVTCGENFSGTGNKAYIAQLTDAQRLALVPSETEPLMTIQSSILSGIKFNEVVLKNKVNKVDYQSNPNGGGYTATANLVVDKQVADWAKNSRIMNNTGNWIVLLADGSGKFYFLGSKDYDNEFSDAGTTGDAPDSDKGSTVTVTAGPLVWEYMKIEGTMTAVEASGTVGEESYVPAHYTLSQAGA